MLIASSLFYKITRHNNNEMHDTDINANRQCNTSLYHGLAQIQWQRDRCTVNMDSTVKATLEAKDTIHLFSSAYHV